IGLPCAAAFVAALAWAGHGAATEQVPFDALHLPADILHLLAAGAWLGALLPLVLLLVRARRDGDPEALGVAQMATLRFSTLGLTSVGTLIVTGIVNTWFLSGSVPALLGTLYGQLLLLKIALFAAMIAVAGVNQRRLLPALANIGGDAAVRLRAIRKVGRNAALEASLGIGVLAIVGIIGILTPGAHTEPRWPLPFRFDLGEVAPGRQIVLYIAVAAFIVSLAAIAFAVEKRRYREMAAAVGFLVVFAVVGCRALGPGIVDAYPTSFYASTQAYAAPSISRGAPLYAQNCAVCHGANGHGDGPLSAKLPIRPADLTEPHLFAHKVGELYWWVSNGRDNGVMPGFADKLNPDQRWDLINFLLARAAGALTKNVGPQISTAAAPPLPDFAFERDGVQNTLSQTLKEGPALLILFRTPAPRARLEELAQLKQRFAAAGLHVVAVPLDQWKVAAPFIVQAADDARATLALFRSRTDGGETELMLDRGGNVRARWTASGAGGLADPAILLADALRVAKIPVAAANHAGHGH
ncbi:MAG: CopD family protein, partial [Candidatus Eremiobacteraeota bacterium]|nr:CopD family protein [Candidatus Eremiobacteraeota bacterium]